MKMGWNGGVVAGERAETILVNLLTPKMLGVEISRTLTEVFMG